jgi:hypothetical protein
MPNHTGGWRSISNHGFVFAQQCCIGALVASHHASSRGIGSRRHHLPLDLF